MGHANLETITAHELILKNTLADPAILATMATRGYTQERLEEGLALIRAAQQAEQVDTLSDGTKLASTSSLMTLFTEARKRFADFRTAARLALGSAEADPGAWQTLGLKGAAPHGQEAFLGASLASVSAALADPALVEKLGGFGFDQKALEALQSLLSSVSSANQTQEEAKGLRRAARADADAKVKEERRFMSAFKQLARRTLNEAQLTQIGMK